jgi:hypothetical protein
MGHARAASGVRHNPPIATACPTIPAADCDKLAERRSGTVKYRNIDYDIEEIALAQWRWKIYPKIEIGPKETSEATFGSRDAAIAACIIEINNGLDGKNNAPRS